MEFPADMPVVVRDRLDVAQLVAYLRKSSRARPVVVLTVAKDRLSPYISAAEVAAAAHGRADIVTIPTDDLTRVLSELVGQAAGVFRGACRVYPRGDAWEQQPFLVPLRMTRTDDEIANLPRLVLDDLKRAIDAAKTPPTPVVRIRKPVAPTVLPVDATPGPVSLQVNLPADIVTEADAKVLSDYLFSARREHPIVVVSRATGATEAAADTEALRQELTGLADVVEIVTLKASWAFADAVPPMCQVYGGAGRVYPIGHDWSLDPTLSPLRLAYGFHDRGELTRQLISDTMRLASRGSYETQGKPAKSRAVSGKVQGVAGGRGLVQLDSSDLAVLWPELTQPDVAAERLFAKGMKITGDFDPESRRVDVRSMRQDPLQAVAVYQAGQTVLVRVVDVGQQSCAVELFPGLKVEIPAQDVTDDDGADLRDLMSPGETVAALLGGHEDDEWLLSLADADDTSQATPAPAILAGGPPWLVPPAPEPMVPSPRRAGGAVGVAFAAGAADESDVARELRRENEQLAGLLEDAKQQVADLTNQLTMARTRRREVQRRSRADRLTNESLQADADLHLFTNEADQLDFEINLAWARMTPVSDKKTWPLKPHRYGDKFFATLRDLQGVSRDKVVAVIVDALTGRDAELPSRDIHMLRTGSGGDDPPRTRNGGEICWRSAIQAGTPQARRLHYWKCKDGTIELASVRRHDDFDT